MRCSCINPASHVEAGGDGWPMGFPGTPVINVSWCNYLQTNILSPLGTTISQAGGQRFETAHKSDCVA